ncbi:PepSY domain-containing protein [Lysobacter sp. H21R4]|uniref:PepSY domain-containing protein n=1 Tax=Lysobacter sp. H21R4 TaxID=2781021 RepID=UPI00188963CA|nr:PepSY domain-containing protein [Lysobacter sp. H21R4]QOY62054.1 PepSY domain-containing protein [Lysobacter sp. H21R4]
MLKSTVFCASLIVAGSVAAQATSLTQAEAQAKLTEAGYQHVRDAEMDDGFWEADARRADGTWVDVRVHPVTGKVYAEDTTPKLDAEAVSRKLKAAGYTNVRDIDFDDGVWEMDARNKAGVKVDLAVDPDDGAVLSEREDR